MVTYVDLFGMSKYSFHWTGICSYVCNSQLLRGMGVVRALSFEPFLTAGPSQICNHCYMTTQRQKPG